ncbi:MAG: PHP domain-containing protein [Dehalococcoidia bacterium]
MTDRPPSRETAEHDAAAVLRRVAFLLERLGESAYRARAFRTAAAALEKLDAAEVARRVRTRTLADVAGFGPVTATLVAEVMAGEAPAYLQQLEARLDAEPAAPGTALLDLLRGDCHVHSNWSDGRASIAEMAEGAMQLGHDYIVLTDHSPSLKIAHGLDASRLEQQLDVVASLNRDLAPFRILTGIEVDILADGSLDQDESLLARLDVVVGSVHSQLRAPRATMTERLLRAVANPHLDILGHCTGRMRTSKRDRPESEFDAERVFTRCASLGKAIEVNSLPARRDPPSRLIRMAVDLGCAFSIDSDAHAPGELAGKVGGCARAAENGIGAMRVVNALGADDLLAWTRTHDSRKPT